MSSKKKPGGSPQSSRPKGGAGASSPKKTTERGGGQAISSAQKSTKGSSMGPRIPLTSSEGAESPLTASRKPTQEPIRKRTSLSGSKDDGKSRAKGAEGAQKEAVSTTAIAKPSTKAERRALQEAQRKAKSERQITLSKAGQAASKAGQTAREDKAAKEGKAGGGGHKSAGGGGGAVDEKLLHQSSTGISRAATSKAHAVPGLKQVQHFAHLPQYERKARIVSLLKDYHPPPCILQLGLQYSEGLVCGSNSRCIAMLAAFKRVIQDYTTPPEKELRRDLDAVIKPHINFLTQCRPLSVSMGNAIKYLKLKISQIPPEMTENDAKKSLCDLVDGYIQERIELAGKAISQFCVKVIDDGDVILVHAYSSIVQCCLIDAHRSGKKFRVIVVDSRPKMEGEECVKELIREGIKCSYVLICAVSYIMKEVSKVIFGAHGLLANGYVMSRIGTSLIALVAKSFNVPVLVCCETYKFCDKVLTDCFVSNELGDPNDLVPIHRRQGDFLQDWKSIENLQLLNLVYDVTSPDLISMVITQLGNIPCTSVPVVLRISHTFEQM